MFYVQDDFLLRHYDSGECQGKLGHSRLSVILHRAQVRAGHKCKYPVSNFLSAGHRDFCRLRNSPAGGFSPPPRGCSLSHMLQVQVTPSQRRDSWHQDMLEMLMIWVTKMLTHLKTYFIHDYVPLLETHWLRHYIQTYIIQKDVTSKNGLEFFF